MTENKPIYGVCKYKNIMGVSCYMNSILHILQQLPYFTKYIYNKGFEETISKKMLDNPSKDFLVNELYKLFKLSLDNEDAIITPYRFKRCIGNKNIIWNDVNHQDSQEFLNFLLSELQEEVGINYEIIYGNLNCLDDEKFNDNIIFNLKNIIAYNTEVKYKCKEASILSSLFNGLLESSTQCMCCNSNCNIYELFLTLCLTIPQKNEIDLSIYDCLDELIKDEQLDSHNMSLCELCGLKNRAYKKTLLWKTPKILIIHLKRFSAYNILTGLPSQKLTDNIFYPIKNLNLEKYFNIDSPYKNKSKYNLIGINIHKGFGTGKNINYGHYISIIKNNNNKKWYLYNDENPVKEINKDELQNPDAYLLFYYQQD
jgi:ubiquitin C-terminal hydrolase